MDYFLVDDSVEGVGGTMLTLDAIIEPNLENVSFIKTSEFSLKDAFRSNSFFIFGNIMGFSANSLDAIKYCMENSPFVKIEFDYGYCKNRGRIPHKILSGTDCDCPKSHLSELYDLIRSKSLHIFYMSKGQMEIHNEDLKPIKKDLQSILSSCFLKSNLLLFNQLKIKEKNSKYAIIDGNGGWHSKAKGVDQSIAYAEENNFNYDLIKTNSHVDLLHKLSDYKALISLPIIHDTCPRITIEARYMGLEVITNDFSQHITEDWWKGTDEEALSFTSSRPDFFWQKIKCLN